MRFKIIDTKDEDADRLLSKEEAMCIFEMVFLAGHELGFYEMGEFFNVDEAPNDWSEVERQL